jgi:predicted phosphodiesterase
MRIAILSDIHGNLAALEAVVADFKQRGVDAVVNLGDSLSGPLLPGETAQFLMAQAWVQLAGNHERQLLTLAPDARGASDTYTHSQLTQVEFSWMASLQPTSAFGDEGLLCHGTPNSDAEYFLETVEPGCVRAATQHEIETRLGDVSAVFIACGHTHLPRSVRSLRGQLIVNPGSIGLPAYTDERPYHHAIENGSPEARYAIVEKRGDRWSSELIAVSYDHESMARLARLRGRSDWECALQYGCVGANKSS